LRLKAACSARQSRSNQPYMSIKLYSRTSKRLSCACKTGGFQGIKDRRFNDLQMFWPRFIRVASGQEQRQETQAHRARSRSSAPHSPSSPSDPAHDLRPALGPDMISDCALNCKSKCCNDYTSVISPVYQGCVLNLHRDRSPDGFPLRRWM
jgi:hypothetical protein